MIKKTWDGLANEMIQFIEKRHRFGIRKYTWEKLGEMDRTIVAFTFFKNETSDQIDFEFYSTLFGIVKWSSADRKFRAQSWEAEIEAQSISALNYHYTAKLLSHTEDELFAKKVIEDVLRYTEDKKFNELIISILNGELTAFTNILGDFIVAK